MFISNNEFKNNYLNTLKQINDLGADIRNDADKIRLLGLINNLKYYANVIEPQASIDLYNKKHK